VKEKGVKKFVTGMGLVRAAGASGLVVLAGPGGPAAAQDYVVTSHNSNPLSVVDRCTHAVQTIAMGAGSNGIAVAPDGSAVYVVVSNTGVRIIDPATLTVTDTIAMSGLVFDMRVMPDGNRAYVTRGNTPTVFEVDLVNKFVVQELTAVSNAVYLDMTPDGSQLYISTSRTSSASSAGSQRGWHSRLRSRSHIMRTAMTQRQSRC
jgi:DNA-binding beta-propeller fold protein YncE